MSGILEDRAGVALVAPPKHSGILNNVMKIVPDTPKHSGIPSVSEAEMAINADAREKIERYIQIHGIWSDVMKDPCRCEVSYCDRCVRLAYYEKELRRLLR